MVNIEGLLKHLSVVNSAPFGVLSHQASSTADILHSSFGERMAALFSPEHGWFGIAAAGEKTVSVTHPYWNIPVHSLYGEHKKPSPEMFNGISRIVIDLQDIGVRCYTYLATMKLMLEAASEAGIAVTILDRPIPLGGILDGPMREIAFSSFVAPLNIPLCHGMTPGECAKYIDKEEKLNLDLTVIKMKDWSHASREPWVNFMPPSPGIRSWDSAVMYPATVFSEAFPAIDCDRYGALAFRVLGAPWLDVAQLLEDFSDVLPACGMSARQIKYRATGGNYDGQTLNGILLQIENPDAFYPVTAGTIILAELMQRHAEELKIDSRPEWLNKLIGSTDVFDAFASNSLSDLFQKWIDEQDSYLAKRVDLYS